MVHESRQTKRAQKKKKKKSEEGVDYVEQRIFLCLRRKRETNSTIKTQILRREGAASCVAVNSRLYHLIAFCLNLTSEMNTKKPFIERFN